MKACSAIIKLLALHPVIWTDVQTDMEKLISLFCKFYCERAKEYTTHKPTQCSRWINVAFIVYLRTLSVTQAMLGGMIR
jgi:hypothetical protein